jgi:Lipase/PEP-CTERM motif
VKFSSLQFKSAVAAFSALLLSATAQATLVRYDFQAVGARNTSIPTLNGASFFGSFTFDTQYMPSDTGNIQSAFYQGGGTGNWIRSSLFAAGSTAYNLVTSQSGTDSAAIFQRLESGGDNTFSAANVQSINYTGNVQSGTYSMRVLGSSNTINGILPTVTQNIDGVPFVTAWRPLSTGRFYSDNIDVTYFYSNNALITTNDNSYRVEGNLSSLAFSLPVTAPPANLPPPTLAPSPLRLITDLANYDPQNPTIVITHGWQPLGIGQSDPSWVGGLAQRIKDNYTNVNIVEVYWDDAVTLTATAEALRSATAQVAYQGNLLSSALRDLPGNMDGGIQFIGHSLGTHVNAYAANNLTTGGLIIDQFTILDRPFGQGIRPDFIAFPVGGDVDQQLFRTLLPQGSVKFVDNYFGNDRQLPTPATGASFEGLAVAFNREYWGADHTGVHENYANTIGERGCIVNGGGFGCSIINGNVDNILNVFAWDPHSSDLQLPSSEIMLRPNGWLAHNCVINGQVSEATCSEGSPAYLWLESLDLASDATFLSFDFLWLNSGDGDWLTLHFGDTLLYNGMGNAFTVNEFSNSGLLPIYDLSGKSERLLFTLNSAGDRNASFSIKNIKVFGSPSGVPEPSSWAMIIVGFGFLGIALRIKMPTARRQFEFE